MSITRLQVIGYYLALSSLCISMIYSLIPWHGLEVYLYCDQNSAARSAAHLEYCYLFIVN
jgi:hypothetical protein